MIYNGCMLAGSRSRNEVAIMTDPATDFGQVAYGQFDRPLTDKLREHGIDSIGAQHHGFSGRSRTFHTGYEGIVYLLALDEEGLDSVGLRFDDKQLHRPVFEALRLDRRQIQLEIPTAWMEWVENDTVLWISVSKEADRSAPVPERIWTRDWMYANLVNVKNVLQLRLSKALQRTR